MDFSTLIEIVKLSYSLGESATAAIHGCKTEHGLIKDPFAEKNTETYPNRQLAKQGRQIIRLTKTRRLLLPDEPELEGQNRSWAVEAFSATL
ncbi:hypothetical protein T265_08960 [Opisthorchis viverrini]|uniref:Uncharacterized protein n=1 Tax=Opisthorchis viverrini TaxID=6198 RepID=A0A074ZIC0_OPIVI|nr:hypothetical protein T265_08960 [Opisthorchis viverrini]KER23060.1 hypothetical protein T265_08960 [Opisthorchis viverrini]